MNEFPKELTALHEALKDSKAAKYFIKYSMSDYRLTLESPSTDVVTDNSLPIHIEVDKNNPGRFTYMALTNEYSGNPEAFHKIEEKENVTTEEIIEVAYRLLKPMLRT